LRYFLHLAYSGARYHGWQKQPAHPSVQGTVEVALRRVLKEEIFLVGCGRTDAGVHAAQYFLHFDTERPLTEENFFRVQRCLPPDICLYEAVPVDERRHARFDAWSRSYDYFAHFHKDVVLDGISAYYPQYEARRLDFELMGRAAALFTQYGDFRGFCRRPDKNEHTRCTVTEAQLFVGPERDRFRFRITSNRFLKAMVRLIVRELILVGSGKISVDAVEEHLRTGHNPTAILSAYPQGLYLSEVRYPYLERPMAGKGFSALCGKAQMDWEPV
jgi:tRNA pseudouridine38-40 synthase